MGIMQIQNKYKHLHYLLCLGGGLRKANSDITHDALPEQIEVRLKRLAQRSEATSTETPGAAQKDHRG